MRGSPQADARGAWWRGPVLKVAFSAVLVAILVRRYGGDPEFRHTLSGLELRSFASAEAVLAVGLVVSAIRWKVLLRAAGVPMPLASAVRLYFVSFFFNFLLPTSVGGDVVRAMGASARAPLPVVAGTILVERFLGFGCLLVIGLAASLLVPSLATARGALLAATGAFAAGGLVLALAPLPEARPGGLPGRVLGGLRSTALEFRSFGFHPRALVAGTLLSLVWQGALVLANVLLSDGLGGVASLRTLAAVVPVVQAVTMIPVSFGGLGLREMGYEFFFASAGLDPAHGVALGACFLGVSVALAVKGGLVQLVSPVRDAARTRGGGS
jgi:uncharacterized membrane protein YbhN (UPF0104 family)